MNTCAIETVKRIGMFVKVPISSVTYSTDKVVTAVINKENVDGFASVILRLAEKYTEGISSVKALLIYQWLEYLSQFADKLSSSPLLARNFLIDLNITLEGYSYIIGHEISIADVAVYHVLYELLDRSTISERLRWPHVCRWAKHIQSRDDVRAGRDPLPIQYFHDLCA